MGFRRFTARGIGTSGQQVGSTVPANVNWTVFAAILANTSTSVLAVDAYHYDGVNTTYLVKGAEIPVGSSLTLEKIVMTTGDQLFVRSNVAASLDVLLGVLEQ